MLQPRESAELPDEGEIKWAPLAPYWSVLWRSGVGLASALAEIELSGRRVVELGCGLGVPSMAAARAGAEVLATDAREEPLELLARNAAANGVRVETMVADWYDPAELLERGPFDLALASDLIYLEPAVEAMLELLPGLAPRAWVAAPDREDGREFLDRAASRWPVESSRRGDVGIHRLRMD